jgi:hypothetical protein
MSAPPTILNGAAVRAAEQFLELLSVADGGAIERLFPTGGSIDQPLWGMARGLGEIHVMVSRAGGWLGDRRASVKHVATTSSSERAVAEHVVHLTIDGKAASLPVAVVADAPGGVLSAIRTYHSTWPMAGSHSIRTPTMPRDPRIVLTGLIGAYQRALAAGDVEGLLAAYEDDAYAREPSGGEYVYRGKARLRQLYTMRFMRGGGIPLEYCTMTDDGVRCAIEFICNRWGKTEIVPQAGIAVYERGSTGRVAATRIYDDVNPLGPSS